jgi:hypothetical protein
MNLNEAQRALEDSACLVEVHKTRYGRDGKARRYRLSFQQSFNAQAVLRMVGVWILSWLVMTRFPWY